MSQVNDEKRIFFDIQIPGTHDTGSFNFMKNCPFPSFDSSCLVQRTFKHFQPYIVTQALDIGEQLEMGIRYFDLRLLDSNFQLYHGPMPLKFNFQNDVISKIKHFLFKHKTETVLVKIKLQGHIKRHSDTFRNGMEKLFVNPKFNNLFWFPTPADLIHKERENNKHSTLGEVRGKIVLLLDGLKFNQEDKTKYIPYEDFLHKGNNKEWSKDFKISNVASLKTKKSHLKDSISQLNTNDKQAPNLIQLSGTCLDGIKSLNDLKRLFKRCEYTPQKVAMELNKYYVDLNIKSKLGFIVTVDFPSQELIKKIINGNEGVNV